MGLFCEIFKIFLRGPKIFFIFFGTPLDPEGRPLRTPLGGPWGVLRTLLAPKGGLNFQKVRGPFEKSWSPFRGPRVTQGGPKGVLRGLAQNFFSVLM